ncbi:MAG: hypothetical protein D6737_07490 [Chloroflexi bacterium]|nr:MAG: hypothetical protein D6737_07490 [Chloroflexota bacterium]
MNINRIEDNWQPLIDYLWPALFAGLLSWGIFTLLGSTPLIRASGLALVIIGMTLILRRLGEFLAIIGGLALALSEAFWSQTGGNESLNELSVVLAMLLAAFVGFVLWRIWTAWYVGAGIGLVIFAAIFWLAISTTGSLRLTTLLTAWLTYLLIDGLREADPRPDEMRPATPLRPRHRYGIPLLLTVGVINDPLFTLLIPAAVLGLILTKTHFTTGYWLVFVIIALVGAIRMTDQYFISSWWGFSAAEAEAMNLHVPFVIADGWREASRWVGLFALVRDQFTIFGIVLGVIGLSRLARWYPSIGIVTMLAYATYTLFGLVYFGNNRIVLLLPLLMIQIIWMTYAVYSFGQWLQKSVKTTSNIAPWLVQAVFAILPFLMFLRILGD